MTRVYLNTLVLLEFAVCFGMIAFFVLVKTGLYTMDSSNSDFVLTLNGEIESTNLIFDYVPTGLGFDMEAGNGCLVSDLSILASLGGCVREYCSGWDNFDHQRVTLVAGAGCTFHGVLRFQGAGLVRSDK